MTEIDYQILIAEWEGMPSNAKVCLVPKQEIESKTVSNSEIDLDILRAEGEGMLMRASEPILLLSS